MKASKKLTIGVLSSVFALPVIAEPAWWMSLSFDQDEKTISQQQVVAKTSGMNKYLPYSERYSDRKVDTEIAAFEEVHEEKKATYERPVRNDRIPRL